LYKCAYYIRIFSVEMSACNKSCDYDGNNDEGDDANAFTKYSWRVFYVVLISINLPILFNGRKLLCSSFT